MQEIRPNAEAVNNRVKLLFHRLIARRLKEDPSLLDEARKDLQRQRDRYGEMTYIAEWTELLDKGVDVVRREIVRRSERMTWLRISSPLGVAIDVRDVDLRRRVWRRSSIALRRQMTHSRIATATEATKATLGQQ
jgi:hypothetical protein